MATKYNFFHPRFRRHPITNRVALFLYRVEVDETRRNVDLPRLAPNAPRRRPSGLSFTTCSPCGGSVPPRASR
jgi:hypothetical protein